MFYPATNPLYSEWLPNFSQWLRQWFTALSPAPVSQVLLPPGDAYTLEAGSYRLRVLAGSVWVPTVGIFTAGEQIMLTVDVSGLAIQSYANHTAVLAVRTDR